MEAKIEQLKNLIERSSQIAVFTGAGISTESGVSDYRSKGGIWDRFQPVTLQEFLVDPEKRREYWRRKKEMYAEMRDSQPNAGHFAIARLEKQKKLIGVITQNIDGLHQKAGSQNVLELHGTNREVICLSCGRIGPFDPVYERLLKGEEIPLCNHCGGLLKPNTISFGQALDPDLLNLAFQWAQQCDLLLAVGSTLIVEPAASIPRTAKDCGALLVIINRESTPLDSLADLVIHGTAGNVLDAAIRPLRNPPE
jgi:NAD-dependent deacetylase